MTSLRVVSSTLDSTGTEKTIIEKSDDGTHIRKTHAYLVERMPGRELWDVRETNLRRTDRNWSATVENHGVIERDVEGHVDVVTEMMAVMDSYAVERGTEIRVLFKETASLSSSRHRMSPPAAPNPAVAQASESTAHSKHETFDPSEGVVSVDVYQTVKRDPVVRLKSSSSSLSAPRSRSRSPPSRTRSTSSAQK